MELVIIELFTIILDDIGFMIYESDFTLALIYVHKLTFWYYVRYMIYFSLECFEHCLIEEYLDILFGFWRIGNAY